MPPGIYSEDEDTGHSGLKSVGAVLLVGVASFMVFTAFKSAKNWGGFRRGWHAVTDAEASSINQVRRRGEGVAGRDLSDGCWEVVCCFYPRLRLSLTQGHNC